MMNSRAATTLIGFLLLPFFLSAEAPDTLRFQKVIRELRDILQLPGLSIAVVKDGQVVYRQMEGYANIEKKIPVRPDHLFMIASVTKTFTANLLMQYEQEHLTSIDDYALKYRFIDIGLGWPYDIDPNIKVRHFLSHTSEDGPGNSFVYNGTRFNFIGGLFESVTGVKPFTDAYAQELQKRIWLPLQMDHTIPAFPVNRSDTLYRHIATPYVYDREQKKFVEDTVNYARWTRVFPSGSLLSTIDDLVKYTRSYDEHTLISTDSYKKVTTPTILNDGSISPYGIGWFTETFGGKSIHWHYGHADSYASLYIRVPETGYTFILLTNSNAPSEALRLGSGHIWQSPFAAAFLKTFVFAGDKTIQQQLDAEEPIGRALFLYYAQKTFGTHNGEAQLIIKNVVHKTPERFDRYDPGVVYLLTDLRTSSFHPLINQLANAYRRYGHLQPYVAMDLARYYEQRDEKEQALEFYKQLADANGFAGWWQATEACRKTGRILIEQNKKEAGRRYYWKAVNNAKKQYADDTYLQQLIHEMNQLCNE